MSDKFKVANVFTESEIQIGSLSVDDFQKIRSEARRDLTLHGWQWLNAGTVAYRTYFATMKCFIFAFGLVLALLFIFGGKGFDANVTELHDIIMNGLPVDKASELPEFYWAVLCVLGLILTSSAQVACMAAFMAVAASYINLFTDKINIFKGEVNKYICKLSGLLGVKLANQEVADNNEDPVLYRRPLPFPHTLGYNDYFHESIEKKIKVLLQEQTDSPIVVKIKNDPVMS